MAKRSRSEALRHALSIQPGEGRTAFLFFLYSFLIAAPQTIIRTLRTTDFLVKLGVGALPVAYLLAAVASGLVVLLHTKTRFRASLRGLIASSLVFFGVTGLFLQWLLQTDSGRKSLVLPYFYWVWASVLIVMLLTHFWMTINEMFNPRQARRLIGFLNSGGILGGILGGCLVVVLTKANRGGWLMPLACLMLFVCSFVVSAVFKVRPGPSAASEAESGGRGPGFRASFETVRRDRFLAHVAAIVFIGVIVSTCIEFQFFSAAEAHFVGRPRNLQAFLGMFDPSLTVFAFFLNLLMAGYLLKKLNVARALLLTPAVLLACSLGVLLTPFALLPAILIRAGDEGLAFSVNQPVREILYIPVAASLKHRAKPFIDIFVSQIARVAGAIVLLIFALLLRKEIRGLTPIFDPELARKLSWVVIALLVPWGLSGLKIGKEYLAILAKNIRPFWNRAERDVAEGLDVAHAKLVFDTIDSRQYSSVLYALHLFDLLARDRLGPDVRKILAEKSGEVGAAALNDRFEADGAARFPEILDELPRDEILTEIPLIMSSDAYQQVMTSHLENLRREGGLSEIERMELAKAIGLMPPDSDLASWLGRLIEDPSAQVSCLALRSAARLRNKRDLPAIIRKLGDYLTHEDAADALRLYGDAAVGSLEQAMKDRSRATALRGGIVEVLGRIGTRKAVAALVLELERGCGDLDHGIIDALDRVRSDETEIPLPPSAAVGKIRSLIRDYCRISIDLHRRGPGEGPAALRHHLARAREDSFSDIFKLLGLCYPQKDIRTAFQNITRGNRSAAAHAVEWLDNTLKKDVRDILLPLVEDLAPEEKAKRFEKILKSLSEG
jgi:AAA family ATP:ADP antiporter